MSIEYEIDTTDAVKALTDFGADINDEITEILEQEFEKVVQDAKTTHRFRSRTGRLENAVQSEISEFTARAFIDDALAPHGKYIHGGFKSWAPDPFLEEAFDRNSIAFDAELDKTVDRLIRKHGLA